MVKENKKQCTMDNKNGSNKNKKHLKMNNCNIRKMK